MMSQPKVAKNSNWNSSIWFVRNHKLEKSRRPHFEKGNVMNVEIAERLAKRRKEAGYSQESLAERLGVSRQAVSKWERSESSPDTDNLIALAQLYGVSLDDLLYVEESIKDDVAYEAADKAAARKAEEEPSNEETVVDAEASSENKKKVHVGFDGIHVKDGEDYVHVSWRDGVHVKDNGDGDEVHIGWDGVHVKEGKKKGDWFGAGDDEGNTFHWSDEQVVVNGKEYDSWHEARKDWGHDDNHSKAWLRFPFPLVIVTAYILLGVFLNTWGIGLFLLFLIPLYYMVGKAVTSKKIGHFFAGVYPLAATAWFCWMAFIVGAPHPAWVIFLTIPLVEWAIHSISRWWKRRKKQDDVIDVAAEVTVEPEEQ